MCNLQPVVRLLRFVVFTILGVMHAAAVLLATDGMSSAKAALGQALRDNPSPKISKSDEDFERMGVEFVWGYHELNLDELNDLFSRVSPPWCRNSVTLHLVAESKIFFLLTRKTKAQCSAQSAALQGMPVCSP